MKLALGLAVATFLTLGFGNSAQAFWGEFAEGVTFGLYKSDNKPANLDAKEVKSYDAVDKAIKETNKEVLELNATLKGTDSVLTAAEQEIERIKKEISSQNQALERAREKSINTNRDFESETATEEQVRKDAEALIAANRKLKAVKSSLESPMTQRSTALREFQEADVKLAEKLAKAKAYDAAKIKITKLENTIAGMRLSTSMKDFEDKIKETQWDIDLGFEALERVYDDSILKAYMKKKFENVLNSSSFCESVKQCSDNSAGPDGKVRPQGVKISDDDVFGSKAKSDSSGSSGSSK